MADQTVEINLKVNSTGTANISETRKALEMLGETATKVAGTIQVLAGSHNVSQGLASSAQAASNRMVDLQKQASAAASAVEKFGTSKLPVDDYVRLNTALRQAEAAIVGASKAQEKLTMNLANNNAGAASKNIEAMHKNMSAADQALWGVNTKMAQLAGEASKIPPHIDNANRGLATKNAHLDSAFFRVAKLVIAYQAIYSVINLIGKGFDLWKSTLMTGLDAVEEYRMTIVGGAALLTSLTDKSVPIEQAYKDNKEYMTWFVQATKEVDKYVAAGAEDMQKAGREMMGWGVAPRTIEQVKSLGMMVDALKVATAGMGNQSGQLFTEIRALFMGDSAKLNTSQLLQSFMKVDHDVINKFKQIRENMKETQDPTEFFNYTNTLLRGYAAASGDIQMMLSSLQTTATSTFKTVMVAAFGEAYDSIVKYGWALLDLIQVEGRLTQAGERLAAVIRNVWDIVSVKIDSWVNNIISDPDALINSLNSVFVAVGNIGKAALIAADAVIWLAGKIENLSNKKDMSMPKTAGDLTDVVHGITNIEDLNEKYSYEEAARKIGDTLSGGSKEVTDAGSSMSDAVGTAGSNFNSSVISAANSFASIVSNSVITAGNNALATANSLKITTEDKAVAAKLFESGAISVDNYRTNKLSSMPDASTVAMSQQYADYAQKQQVVKPPKYGSGVYDPIGGKKGGGGGGGSAESEARRLMSLFDTLNKDIARLSEGKIAEVEANLTKTLDQIYNRQEQRAVSHEELVILAKKRASLQKEKVEDEYQMYIARGDASGIEKEKQSYKEALKNFGNTEAKKAEIKRLHLDNMSVLEMKAQEKSLTFQKSYIDAAASAAPTTQSQLGFQKQSLELEIEIGNLKLEQSRTNHEINESEYQKAKYLKDQTDEYRRQAQIREGWKGEGFSGGIKAFDYENRKRMETYDYDTAKTAMESIRTGLSSTLTSSIMDGLKGNEVTFDEIGFSIAEAMISKMVEGWVNQVMPLVSSLMNQVGSWLGFGGGGSSLFSSGGQGMGILGNMASSIGGLLSAKGNIFDSGGFHPFARGGIVSSPTLFPFANGTGLMGEAGPEAIMPLTRTSTGQLGVMSNGGSAGPINITVQNNSSTPLKGEAKKGSGDREFILMLDELNSNLIGGSSKTTRALDQRYGLKQSTTSR